MRGSLPLVTALRAELDSRYPEEIAFEHPTVKEAARFLLATVDGVVMGLVPCSRGGG